MPTFDELTRPAPEPGPADWNDDGVVILEGLIPDDVMTAYEICWLARNHGRPGGWPHPTPYRDHRPVADLFCDPGLQAELARLLGQPAGLHLCLTGWVTTTRNWHQDSYLNPPHVGDDYAAVWIALDDIHPDSGPFQYVPGSHRWPQVTREDIAPFVDLGDPAWPTHSEQVLTPIFEQEIERRQAEIVTHLPRRGDVLIWHGRLLHRGSPANTPNMERRAAIAHYSGINSRQDMPAAEPHDGGWVFPIGERGW